MNPITEFFVGLSWKIDEQSKRKMLDHIEDVGKRITELSLAFVAGAAARSQVFETIVGSLDHLYWQAQRTHSTVGQIRALGGAAEAVGTQAEVMTQALESFSQQLRQLENTPGGAARVLRENGVEHPETNTDAQNLVALIKALEKKYPYGTVVSIMAEHYHVSEMAVYTATRKNFEEEVKKFEQREGLHGIDPKDPNFGEKSAKLTESKNEFVQSVDTILYSVAERLAGPTGEKLERLTALIDANSVKIRDFLVDVGKALMALADGLIHLIETRDQWLSQLKEMATGFKNFAVNVSKATVNTVGWKGAIELLLLLLIGRRLGTAIGAIGALALAFASFMKLFGATPAEANTGSAPTGEGGGETPAGAAGGGAGAVGGGGAAVDPGAYSDTLRGRAGGVFSRVRAGLNKLMGGADPGAGSKERFNTAGLFQLMKQAGASDAEARTLAAIGMAESRGRPSALNPYGRDYSFGLWQINMLGRMGPERLKRFGLKSYSDLYDPKTNARVALQMAREAGGYRDWSTYSSGAYRQFYGGEARATPMGPGLGGPVAATVSPPPIVAPLIDKEKAKFLHDGSRYFDLHGFRTDIPPGVQNTWNNTIKNSSTKQHLTIDVHGMSDPHAVAQQVTKAVTRAHDNMIKEATGGPTSALPKGTKETKTGHAPPGAQSGVGERKSGNNHALPALVIDR